MAGCGGSTSSEQGADWNVANNGAWGGVMVSMDSGETWATHEGLPVNYYVTALELLAGPSRPDLLVLAAARSNFFDANDGGIWRGSLLDTASPWERVVDSPTYDLAVSGDYVLAALPYSSSAAVLLSTDGGATFNPFSEGLDWGVSTDGGAMTPFYPTVKWGLGGTSAFLGALTVDPAALTLTGSKLYARTADQGGTWASPWTPIAGGPANLDDDRMPKDRLAILPDPFDNSTLYVAGNGGQVAWRVEWETGVWISLLGDDTYPSRKQPHVDCRNFAFHTGDGGGGYLERLVLVSDGGIFARDGPKAAGGAWRSLNGNIRAMEFVDAHYHTASATWVAGAQDNLVQLSGKGAFPSLLAKGFVGGDGTVTGIDPFVDPPRFFGCIQFLGASLEDDRRRALRAAAAEAGIPANVVPSAFKFTTLAGLEVGIPLLDHFNDYRQFPFFVQQFTLNAHAFAAGYNGTKLLLWANNSLDGAQAAGIYEYSLPAGLRETEDVAAPVLRVATGAFGDVLALEAGGVVAGQPDPSLLVALTPSALLVQSEALTGSAGLVERPLPFPFASPLNFGWDADGDQVLGPVSHGKTVSLAVSPTDAATAAAAGWASIETNDAPERVFVTRDAGLTWADVFGDLAAATATPGKARPSGLLLLPLPGNAGTALLAGTVSGVYYTLLDQGAPGVWARLGSCAELPLVYVMNLRYEQAADTVVAATMGRGVYTLAGAAAVIAASATAK